MNPAVFDKNGMWQRIKLGSENNQKLLIPTAENKFRREKKEK